VPCYGPFYSLELTLIIFSSDQYTEFIPLTFLWASLEALFLFLINYFQGVGNIKRLTAIQVASSSVKIGLIITLSTIGYNLIGVVISVIISQTIFVTVLCWMIINDLGFPKMQLKGIKRFLAFSLPYIPSGILFFIISSSDKFFIAHLLNLSEAGIYAASYSIGSIILFFSGSISFVLYPKLIKLWEQKETMRLKTYLEYSIKLFLALAIPGSAGLYILSQPLLGLLATSEYAAGGVLVLLIALGTTMYGLYQITVCIICLAEQTKWLPLAIALSAATNICINLALIPKIGIVGAACSMVVAYFVLAIFVSIWAGKIFHYSIGLKFIAKIVLATILMAFCLSFINVGSALSIALTTVIGLIIFGAGLLLLRVFSRDDQTLIREILSSISIKF
jgi:O-antigen/teichoic acid export membrane protein